MAKVFTFLILLLKLSPLKGNEEIASVGHLEQRNKGGPTYSFGYGVSDVQTGDIKTVWESKEGDTVKGHYSVLEPDGSVRTVEYSASPGKGFIAAINNDGVKTQTPANEQQSIQDKSYRDYKRPFDISDDTAMEFYSQSERKNRKRPYDSFYKDYSMIKRPSYHMDLQSGDFPYNPSIKHLRDAVGFDGESHSHIEFGHNSDCKIKHTKDGSYKNMENLDFRRHKYPFLYSDSYDKYTEPTNDDFDKYLHYKSKGQFKSPRPDEIGLPTSVKYSYPVLPDMPNSENIYHDDVIQRPKKKQRPHKNKEVFYSSDDLSDYVLVPKKKFKKPPRVPDISDYSPDIDEDYDHFDDDDDRNHNPFRVPGQKEVVRKIIKKKRPAIINLLDILDI